MFWFGRGEGVGGVSGEEREGIVAGSGSGSGSGSEEGRGEETGLPRPQRRPVRAAVEVMMAGTWRGKSMVLLRRRQRRPAVAAERRR